MLWPCGVCCGRVVYVVTECTCDRVVYVVYVVAEWCILWPCGVCCDRVVYVVAESCML